MIVVIHGSLFKSGVVGGWVRFKFEKEKVVTMEEKSLDGDAWMSSRKLDCEWKMGAIMQGGCAPRLLQNYV
jgi:hypothetical protein